MHRNSTTICSWVEEVNVEENVASIGHLPLMGCQHDFPYNILIGTDHDNYKRQNKIATLHPEIQVNERNDVGEFNATAEENELMLTSIWSYHPGTAHRIPCYTVWWHHHMSFKPNACLLLGLKLVLQSSWSEWMVHVFYLFIFTGHCGRGDRKGPTLFKCFPSVMKHVHWAHVSRSSVVGPGPVTCALCSWLQHALGSRLRKLIWERLRLGQT